MAGIYTAAGSAFCAVGGVRDILLLWSSYPGSVPLTRMDVLAVVSLAQNMFASVIHITEMDVRANRFVTLYSLKKKKRGLFWYDQARVLQHFTRG